MIITNFNAGPCQLSPEVLEQAALDMIDYQNTGVSICELNHMSDEWKNFNSTAIQDAYDFLQIPEESYECFYINGGGTHQFSSICYNLCKRSSKIQVLISGFWSNKAAQEISKYCNVDAVYDQKNLVDSEEYVFTYYCENETVTGYEFVSGLDFAPTNHFLVSDMCSILGSKLIDITKFGVIFCSLSKNLGISGSSLIICRKNILDSKQNEQIPTVLDWNSFRDVQSPKITPSFMSIYITGINLKRMINRGGLAYYHALACLKSGHIYEYIDKSKFYFNDVPVNNRSRTNITFSVNHSVQLGDEFTSKATARGFIGTKHHRANPDKGCRISLYNGLELEELNRFIEFMEEFKNDYLYDKLNIVLVSL